jgi:ubiquinone/menaquinone biosynthesis C-methylase UbiE
MSFGRKLMQTYFNTAYNQVYDFTTARLNRYRKLQERCIGKLELKDNDKVLCVGIGTGNEVFHILEMSRNISITGVDYSSTALCKAYKKALRLGREIDVLIMDARKLEFAAGSFDKVLCIHVMDFIAEDTKVTSEILRVLKKTGQFVITYPSGKEGSKLGFNLLKDGIHSNLVSGKHRIRAFWELITQMVVGIVYLPLLLRPNKRFYSRSQLEAIVTEATTGDFQIEEDPVYQDFIVYGKK